MKRVIVTIGIFFMSAAAFSQARVTGTVVNKTTKEALIGAVCFLQQDSTNGTVTDVNGAFELKVKPGQYNVVCKYTGYHRGYSVTFTASEEKPVVIQLQLETSQHTIKGVTVTGTRVTNTENAVISEIKKTDNVVVGVSSKQIAKSLDRDAGQVVKRIPGVTVVQDRFINVRGLSERYNAVWLNNGPVPSSETDKRAFSFDVIPSGALDRILVFKTPSPELPGDFAGGVVKIFTKAIPDKNELIFSVGANYLDGSTGKDFMHGTRSKTDWLGYDKTQRVMPSDIPHFISIQDPNYQQYAHSFTDPWTLYTDKSKPDVRGTLTLANVLKKKNWKLGNTLAVFYSRSEANYNITRQDWDSLTLNYVYLDRQSVRKVRAGAMENIAFQYKGLEFDFKTFLNQQGIDKTTFRTNDGLDSKAKVERSYEFNYNQRTTLATEFNGGYTSKNKGTAYRFTLAYDHATSMVPDLRRISYFKNIGDDDSLYYTPIPSGSADPNNGGRFFSSLHENIYAFNHNLKQHVKLLDYTFDLNLGNYIEKKKRTFAARQLGYVIKPSATGYYAKFKPIDSIFANANVGGALGFNMNEITDSTYKYNAANTLVASYVSVNLPLGKRLNASGGVRFEHNTQSLDGYTNPADSIGTHPRIITNYYLPSVNVSYNFSSQTLVRGAYGKTLNRPEFREWAPFYFYDFDFKALSYGSLYSSVVNGEHGRLLDVCKVDNYDLRFEWYPSAGEAFQVGGFYKTFDKPILSISDFSTGNRTFTFANAKSAYAYGVEVDGRKNLAVLDTLVHTGIFRDFNLVANATLIRSGVQFDTAVVKAHVSEASSGNGLFKQKDAPLQGQSPYVFNAGVYYQNDSIGVSCSVLYNVIGPRILFVGTSSDPSRVNPNIAEMPQGMLDVTLSKTFYKHFQLTVGVQNMLNKKVQWLEDTNADNKFDASVDKEILSYSPGRYYTLGLRFVF